MVSARGLPLAATSLTPVSVSSKSLAVKWALASSRLAACALAEPRAEPKAKSSATRQARLRRIAIISPALNREAAAPLPRRRIRTLILRAAARFRYGVVVAAVELHPIRDQILGAGKIRRPGVPRHQARGLPHHVELAVAADFADEDRLCDVVIGQHFGDTAGEISLLDAGQRGDHFVRIGRAGLLHR